MPDDYWELTADFGDYKGVWIDPEKKDTHIPSREQAEALKKKVSGKTGVVTECTREEKRTPPERLYDLTTLQREANRKYGYSADKTLKLAQSLYETHKLLTYPRTDSRYLPNDMAPKIARTMQLLPEPYASFVKAVAPDKEGRANLRRHEEFPTTTPSCLPTARRSWTDSRRTNGTSMIWSRAGWSRRTTPTSAQWPRASSPTWRASGSRPTAA